MGGGVGWSKLVAEHPYGLSWLIYGLNMPDLCDWAKEQQPAHYCSSKKHHVANRMCSAAEARERVGML